MTQLPVSESSDPVGSFGEQHVRMGDETARQRDALRLSAGHLASAVTLQAIELEPFEPARAPRKASLADAFRRERAAARRSPPR